MSAQTTPSIERTVSSRAGALAGGLVLVFFGLSQLLTRFLDLGFLPMLVPGLAMFAAGIITRKSGWLIPAGILSGIALGAMAVNGTFGPVSATIELGGVFLGCLALGFLSIPVTAILFTGERHLWALIPGSIIAMFSLAMLTGTTGLRILELTGYFVPAGLIVAGLAVIFSKSRK